MAWLKDVIGYGTHAARPTAGSPGVLYYETDTTTLFRDNGSTWDALSASGTGASDLLDYDANTSLTTTSGTTLTASTWTDMCANHDFTVPSGTPLIMIAIGGSVQVGSAAANVQTRLLVDSAGTPISKTLGGCFSSGAFPNPLAGATPRILTGLSAGVHTVKAQIFADAASVKWYCDPGTAPNVYSLNIHVVALS